MFPLHHTKSVEFTTGLTRREFLRVSAGTAGLSFAELLPCAIAGNPARDINCILLFLVGGPSQLDTWDLKPAAPEQIRGPFQPIRTNVPGIEIGEHFPRMARMADQYALVRSVHHHAAPIHETGHQLMQTGRLFRSEQAFPHYGAVLSHIKGPRAAHVPPFVVLPGPIGNTGVSVNHGQSAGFLGARYEPLFLSTADSRQTASDSSGFDYGTNEFGRSCLLARRLVEQGVRFVTVNMFDTVFDQITWDCHADGSSLASSLADYKDTLCPMFDQAYTALLEDLRQRGLLRNTLVVAMGEFGRTPELNPRGGRDHWPGCWTILFAGGGIRGGQVIGSSDRIGAEPKDRPVTPEHVAATIYHALGIDRDTLLSGPDGRPVPLCTAEPIQELF
jgi:hypothetical protein